MKTGKKPRGIPSNLLDVSLPAELKPFTSPKTIVLPIETPWGRLSPMVRPGDEVIQKQIIAQDDEGLAPPVYSPVYGVIREIGSWITSNGQDNSCIIIEAQESYGTGPEDESDEETLQKPRSPEELFHKINDAGLIEPDNHRWPLAWRLVKPGVAPALSREDKPDVSRPVEILIINAMDREPGVSVRDAALKNMGKKIKNVISMLQAASEAQNVILAIWEGQELSESMEFQLTQAGVTIKRCPNVYPLALEPLIVQYVTGREVLQPAGDPRLVGVCVVDIITALRAYKAVRTNAPVTDVNVQLISYSHSINHQINVPVGCLLEDCMSALPSSPQGISKVIMGGLFLGTALHTMQVPITGSVEVVNFQTHDELSTYQNRPCINCGKCVDVCPMGLLPNELSKFCEYEEFESAKKNFLFHCIECGLCSFVCPAKRPMVHLMRFGKNEIIKARQE